MEHKQFPNEHDDLSEEKKRKMPEFVDLEKEDHVRKERLQFPPPLFKKPPAPFHLPFRYRVLSLLVGIVAALYTFGGLVVQMIFLLGYALTLFSSKFMKILVLDCWGRVCRGAVVTTTLFIAVFSPQFALVMILSYFALLGTSEEKQSAIERALRKHFGDMMS